MAVGAHMDVVMRGTLGLYISIVYCDISIVEVINVVNHATPTYICQSNIFMITINFTFSDRFVRNRSDIG